MGDPPKRRLKKKNRRHQLLSKRKGTWKKLGRVRKPTGASNMIPNTGTGDVRVFATPEVNGKSDKYLLSRALENLKITLTSRIGGTRGEMGG